jgi:hypothetical protein
VADDWNPNDPDAVRVHYDLGAWTFDQQAELAAELAEAEIPHAWWDDTELVVPEEAEAAADAVIADVEERLNIGAAPTGSAAPAPVALAGDEPTTEYDLGDWTAEERAAVMAMLVDAEIAHGWEGDTLLVPTAAETVVDTILDTVERGEYTLVDVDVDDAAHSAAGADVELPFETLTTFFLAGERLRRNTLDADGLEQLLAAIDVADPARPPYGVEVRLWRSTCALAEQLADALVGDDQPDHDAAATAATALHDLLRPYV